MDDLLDGHSRALLQFSGGKDSRALLELARPHLDRIEVVFVEAGATFPHVRRYVEDTCRDLGARLTILEPDEPLEQYHARVGLPADVLPYWSSPSAVVYRADAPAARYQEPLRCCSARLWEPGQRYIRSSGHTLVLRGSKVADSRVGAPNGHIADGVEYRSPLWSWTDADVLSFLDARGVALPLHYADGVADSLDCWSCTAHLQYHGAAKLAWMRRHTPDLFAALAPRLAAVQQGTTAAALDVGAIILDALEGQ
jgi:3'-phosphoadenosine 5'-phosphosulfate sulfotransferase (PAPS reductase)/FAD synthetase